MTAQRIRKNCKDGLEVALNYYTIISIINSLPLTRRELQLLAFVAIRGSITNPAAKKDFSEQFDSSPATINNMISSLRKNGLFIKENNKIKIHPSLSLDFTNSILIQLHFESIKG